MPVPIISKAFVTASALFSLATFQLTGAPAMAQTPGQACSPDRPATIVEASAPDMPAIAAGQGVTGQVLIAVALTNGGQPAQTSVLQSLGNPNLDGEALRVVRTAAFAPEIHDCQAAPGQYQVIVDFH